MSVISLSHRYDQPPLPHHPGQPQLRMMTSGDLPAIEALLDTCFGPARRQKTAQLLRDGNQSIAPLDHVLTLDDGQIIGSIRYWPVDIDSKDGPQTLLWLGPLAVDPAFEGRGYGGLLMRHSMAIAAKMGFNAVLLVGDAPWYQRFGFDAQHTSAVSLPGPFDPARLLAAPLQGQDSLSLFGMIRLPWSLTTSLAAE